MVGHWSGVVGGDRLWSGVIGGDHIVYLHPVMSYLMVTSYLSTIAGSLRSFLNLILLGQVFLVLLPVVDHHSLGVIQII